jgi:hypothetical protein
MSSLIAPASSWVSLRPLVLWVAQLSIISALKCMEAAVTGKEVFRRLTGHSNRRAAQEEVGANNEGVAAMQGHWQAWPVHMHVCRAPLCCCDC